MNAPNKGFDELFDRLFPVIARTVVRIVDDRAEAEDVTVEAFARALARWRKIGRLDWREAWITRVAVNLAIDRRRRNPPPMSKSSVGRDPTDAVADHEVLVAAMRRLSRRQRAVIGLRYLVGLPIAEIAGNVAVRPRLLRQSCSSASPSPSFPTAGRNLTR
jgi:RNA polymerase sigma factor (sigma-70 family)